MKVKLLRKIRSRGASEITIRSITRQGGRITGMSYGFNDDAYSDIFNFGDTENEVIRKAQHIYWEQTKNYYYKKFKKDQSPKKI